MKIQTTLEGKDTQLWIPLTDFIYQTSFKTKLPEDVYHFKLIVSDIYGN